MTTPEKTAAAGAAAEPQPSRVPSVWPMLAYFPRLLGLVLILILTQHVKLIYEAGESLFCGAAVGLILLLGIGGVMVWKSVRKMYDALCSVPFAIALLLTVAAATALGTFVLQNAPEGVMEEKYGEFLAEKAEQLFLTDVFHSLWFSGLMAVMVLSLALVVLRRPFWRPKQWGFLLTHGGMVAVILGAVLGTQTGARGMIAMHTGETHNEFIKADATRELLPFSIRLDKFEVELYPDELRLVAYRMGKHHPEALQAFPLNKVKDWMRVPKSSVSFRVVKLDEKPAGPVQPQHLIFVKGSSEPMSVEIGQTCKVPGTERSFKVIEFIPCLTIKDGKAVSASDEPLNPALRVDEIGAGKDGTDAKQWLFAKHDHPMRENPLPLRYVYIGASQGPRLTIETRAGKEAVQPATLALEGAECACEASKDITLVFEKRPGEPKVYRSTVSVLEDEKPVQQAHVEVNAPFTYRGYAFYQSNYDPSNLKYSRLQVVNDPGLPLAYLGMLMLSLGVAYIYYVRPRL